ncbi:MAG: hypothetical protein M3Z95_01475 [Actinomycetota bacterium]|nr:hypothetical protein [Actinomycetota bacterium]
MAEIGKGDDWAAMSTAVDEELRMWRQAHPRASLTEIELVVEAATRRLQAHLLGALVSPPGAGTDEAGAEAPHCSGCGGRLQARGQRERAVLTAHQATPLRLRRPYYVCSTCGTGFFPPR